MNLELEIKKEKFVNEFNSMYKNSGLTLPELKYVNTITYIDVKCNKHGIFKQIPNNLLGKYGGCRECKKETRLEMASDNFFKISKEMHNNFYIYDCSVYLHSKKKMKIECPIHGIFEQRPNNHIGGQGCTKCYLDNKLTTKNDYIKDMYIIHNNKYNYNDLPDFINIKRDKIIINCYIHGNFKQNARNHQRGHGCMECFYDSKRIPIEDIRERCNEVHNNIYEYDLSTYENMYSEITIICKTHGSFYQQLKTHLLGYICPKCSATKGEQRIMNYLDKKDIIYNMQHKFDDCLYKKKLIFDFYIPNLNICIEYHGKQHYERIDYFHTDKLFKIAQNRDEIKTKYCLDNNIKLIVIPYYNFDNINDILTNYIKYI